MENLKPRKWRQCSFNWFDPYANRVLLPLCWCSRARALLVRRCLAEVTKTIQFHLIFNIVNWPHIARLRKRELYVWSVNWSRFVLWAPPSLSRSPPPFPFPLSSVLLLCHAVDERIARHALFGASVLSFSVSQPARRQYRFLRSPTFTKAEISINP